MKFEVILKADLPRLYKTVREAESINIKNSVPLRRLNGPAHSRRREKHFTGSNITWPSQYCAYASGLVAYVYEIVARTEQYFCPIKHARRVLGTHARYRRFLDYGAAEDYETRLEAFRVALGGKK